MLDGMTKSFTMLHKQSLTSSDPVFPISPESWQNTIGDKKESFLSWFPGDVLSVMNYFIKITPFIVMRIKMTWN